MKIQIILPEWSIGMPWVGALKKAFASDELAFCKAPTAGADAHVYMWCEDVKPLSRIPCVVFVRRYEFFKGCLAKVDWKKVGHVVFVNTYLMGRFLKLYPWMEGKVSVIYNCFDPALWTYKKHRHGNKIAMVGNVNYRKNIPLALEILDWMPPGTQLHIAGAIQQVEIIAYVREMPKAGALCAFHRKVDDVNKWLDDKDYLLLCSVSEGNPNCVIEAMAKGIKPVIHRFPGCEDQFPGEMLFRTTQHAATMMNNKSRYDSDAYRAWAQDKFSMSNLLDLRDVIGSVCEGVTV